MYHRPALPLRTTQPAPVIGAAMIPTAPPSAASVSVRFDIAMRSFSASVVLPSSLIRALLVSVMVPFQITSALEPTRIAPVPSVPVPASARSSEQVTSAVNASRAPAAISVFTAVLPSAWLWPICRVPSRTIVPKV